MLSTFSKKYPAAISVIPLAAGISISYFTGINLSLLPEWIFLLLLFSFAAFVFLLYRQKARGEFYLFPYLFVIILFGIFSFQYSYYKKDASNISNFVKQENESAVLNAIVIERPDITDDKIKLLLDLRSIQYSGKDEVSTTGTVLATVYRNKFKEDPVKDIRYGDLLEIKGKAGKLPFQRNPGEFDYGEYLKLHGVDAVITSYGFENISLAGHEESNIFLEKIIYPVKDYSVKVIDEVNGGREGEYLKGLLLGERSNIPRRMKEDFINAGVAHIIAVSGLNVAYVSLIIWGLLLFIPVKHSYKIFITIGFLLFYMVLTGSSPSIVRAVIMASIFLISQLAERKPNAYNIISFAALVILVIDPKQLFDAGFILSFSAILSLIIIYPVFESRLKKIRLYSKITGKGLTGKTVSAVIALFTGTMAAQLGTLPITAIMFKKVSIISVIANLFAIPLSNISLAIGFITVLISPISLWLAGIFAALNNFLLYWQIKLIAYCAGFDMAFVQTYFADQMFFIAYYAAFILLLTVSLKNYIPRLIIIAFIVLNYFIWKDVSAITNEAEITYLYCGESNCTLIKMPEGSSVLINCGTSGENYNSAQRTVIPYLKSKGLEQIDLLVINSLDKDEFRNLLYMVNNIKVGRIVLPVCYENIVTDKSFAGNFRDVKTDFVTGSEVLNKQGTFRLYLYYDSLLRGKSMMTQFVYGDQSFVFSDAKLPGEILFNTLYLNDLDLTMQALRVTGSGSFLTTPAELIAESEPEYAVIGETLTGRRKVNSEIFIKTLEEFNYNVLNVGTEGAVILRTNGEMTRRVLWR